MKNRYFTSAALFVISICANAQVMKIYNGETLIATYTQDHANRVVFEERKPDTREFVDLGLLSGLKWATCNIGASSPEEHGDYFSWAEIDTKSSFNWGTYKYCNGAKDNLTKYCTKSSQGTVDNINQLEAIDDVAQMKWGENWRMPTRAEQDELRSSCYWVWTLNYNSTGIAGYIVYKAKSYSDKGVKVYSGNSVSSNYSLSDTHIFLPASGFRWSTGNSYVGAEGYYWSSTLSESNSYYGYYLKFGSETVDWAGDNRCYGMAVRAVWP